MKKPTTFKILFGVIVSGIVASNIALAQNSPQNAPQAAQWNALFDRIIRLEQNVKGLATNGGGASGGFAQTQSNEQTRQMLNEVRQMRQQLLGMDARLRRLEQNNGRSGSVVPGAPAPRQQAQLAPRNPTFAETNLNRFDVSSEPQIFVEIGEPKKPVLHPQQVPAAPVTPTVPIARAAPVVPFAQARTPVGSWQKPAPATRQQLSQNNTRVASLPLQAAPPQNNGAAVPGRVERLTLDGAQVTSKMLAKNLFDRSRADLRARRYGAAESGFKSFLRKYGKNNLAPNAQFMLGETYYVQKNYRLAAQAYLQGYRKFPKARRSSDTLLKLGMAMSRLGQKSQSCGVYESVVSKYKSSNRAVKQAKKEMKRARC